ncbi:fumarate hydratase C-terminal domain-containing protein [Cupriavidus metallidurans]|uniref:Hydro-lyases, Fe-S type, tartrate/fumarate subfamily, beta region n=1 Tax=Cupriavidus metallidurans (strain ATCC 43123 / DSM 2839 / NBRC 102507 / CH34) TaxID=266264 RepID=Q1LBZ6_CUPMC|nr:fumarate hydratase C-terminal domain-containing protein [Cupriavidus metallidurans]ABF12330.1 hydro-lyases, Fe-S type, tartrate/fumarate subfamily, beta region [Cupriavidus metallidurans CH34]QGS32431.1 hydrolyase [Cupriavidus metallidurans]
MATHRLTTPLTEEAIRQLNVGDEVLLSGTIYMARDAAHKRFVDTLARGEPLPVDLKGQVVFYGGPGPTKPGHVIGVVAPTSAYRMDPYATVLFEYGVKGAIGKGDRGDAIRASCKSNTAVCFSAIGGISATLFSCIKSAEIIAYEDLKTEAVQRLVIEDFPLLVTNDAQGRDMYEEEVTRFKKLLNS